MTANTTRKVARKDNPRATSEKRHVTLTLRATGADYDGDADVVRVAGVNITENDVVKLGAHHTLELAVRSRVTLRKKRWDAAQRAAVDRAADAAATADLAALLVDADACKAQLFVLTAQLVKRAAAVELALPKGTHGARVKRADAQKAKSGAARESTAWGAL